MFCNEAYFLYGITHFEMKVWNFVGNVSDSLNLYFTTTKNVQVTAFLKLMKIIMLIEFL